LKARVAANALELARHGLPKTPFYLTGQVGGKPFSIHAEGERVYLTGAAGARQEIDLGPPAPTAPEAPAVAAAAVDDDLPLPLCPMGAVATDAGTSGGPPAPGTSPLDAGLQRVSEALRPEEGGRS
jgi:hypothetical protein